MRGRAGDVAWSGAERREDPGPARGGRRAVVLGERRVLAEPHAYEGPGPVEVQPKRQPGFLLLSVQTVRRARPRPLLLAVRRLQVQKGQQVGLGEVSSISEPGAHQARGERSRGTGSPPLVLCVRRGPYSPPLPDGRGPSQMRGSRSSARGSAKTRPHLRWAPTELPGRSSYRAITRSYPLSGPVSVLVQGRTVLQLLGGARQEDRDSGPRPAERESLRRDP